ncbi:ATP-binding protein [Methanoculleus chikugoensis]|uniref:ASKHA domain-containing protein n=1 Tax=Methanoculleus chikugoensis TaxID=118126 RepID=UPI001FB1CF34|nr:ASKHA domain-containing protein [Methanoculleus chikugoensis]
MRANPGAIERVRIDPPDTLAPSVSTINGLRPRGICGSGLIDLLAELFRACVIDRTGGINLELDHPPVSGRGGSITPSTSWPGRRRRRSGRRSSSPRTTSRA